MIALDRLQELPVYLWVRYRPAEGWLVFSLLLALTGVLAASVHSAEWTPERGVAWPAALIAFFLCALLAGRKTSPLLAGGLIVGYLLVIVAAGLSGLLPWQLPFREATLPLPEYARQQMLVSAERAYSWWLTVSLGESSRETIVFAFLTAMLCGVMAAVLAWSTLRTRRPLEGLAVAGLALAMNAHFGGGAAQLWLAALYIALAALLLAAAGYAARERDWIAGNIDYSTQIRLDLLLAAGAAAMLLMSAAIILPTIRFGYLAGLVQDSPPIQALEDVLQRAFAGVNLGGTSPGGAAGTGVMPRSFLLGEAPELLETVVMTANVKGPPALHWRALSYDIYTGRGWSRSDERDLPIAAGETLPIPALQTEQVVTQTVHWLLDDRTARYAMGTLWRISEDVITAWRGVDDLVIVRGEQSSYEAVSRNSMADAGQLRRASPADVPPALFARYTALPEVPQRVADLAREVSAGADAPYDQALAIESFLRQYPYSLLVPAPPEGRDPVDYFLFELQSGYCDYYASAMVVMARSLGIPARLAIGFLSPPPDERGVYTVRHVDAHSWPELYFAGHGWIEFEPTAPFPVRSSGATPAVAEASADTFTAPTPPPLPAPDRSGAVSRWWGLLLIGLLITGWVAFLRRRPRPVVEGSLFAFGRLQQAAADLGCPPTPTQTPAEFEAALLAKLDDLARRPRLAGLLRGSAPRVQRIVNTYVQRRFARAAPSSGDQLAAQRAWREVRLPFRLSGWLLRLRRIFR